MALPPGAIGSAVRKEKLAWRAGGVKSAFPICSSSFGFPKEAPFAFSRLWFRVKVLWPSTTC
jgi:hypothetical protein